MMHRAGVLFVAFVCVSIFSMKYAAASPLEDMFKSLGSNVNITSPGSYQDQAAGYYSAGGFAMRSKNTSFNPINITLPSINAGCRGIDAYMGSFSFMKGEKLVELLKGLGSQAGSYAFQLALKSTAPQIENLLAQLRKVVMEMNNFMVEDCRMVESLFAAALPKDSAMGQHACSDVLTNGGDEDWFGAREKCKKPAAVAASHTKRNTENPDQLVGDYNLIWKAGKKAGIDKGQLEFIMTAVGTVISRLEGEQYRTIFLSPAAERTSYLNAYLKGGDTELRACDSDKCLRPTLTKKIFSEDESLVGQTRTMVSTIQNNYETKTAFTAAQTQFLSVVGEKIPLYKYIQLSAATRTRFVESIIEYIALHVLLARLEAISNDALSWIEALESVQLSDTDLQKFKASVQLLKGQLMERMGSLSTSLWEFEKRARAVEASITSREYLA